MQTAVNSIAVLALLGVVLLLFGNAALLKMVRDLQAGLTDLQAMTGSSGALTQAAAATVPEFAAADGRPTYVMVVDAACPACHDRSRELAGLSADYPGGHLVALTKDPACQEWYAGAPLPVVVDSGLLGRLAVGLTPTMIKYAPDGAEQWRRVVGSEEDLHRALDLSTVRAT